MNTCANHLTRCRDISKVSKVQSPRFYGGALPLLQDPTNA
jgi:hypothetical protein